MRIASRPLVRRLAFMDEQIRAGRYPNAASLARTLEVHARTVLRDVEFLRESIRAPLAFCRRRNGYYYSDRTFALPLIRLTEGELLSLFLAERLLEQYRGAPFAAQLAGILEKLTASLPNEVSLDLRHLHAAYSINSCPADTGDVDQFRCLTRAVREGRQLELTYWTASRDETCKRVIDPYHLALLGGDWYVFAYCHLREDIRTFVPGRIRAMHETGERFERPADFSIAAYLDDTFRVMRGSGEPRLIRLRFAPTAARYVRERTWHPTQTLKERKDGSLVLTLKVSHFLEVKRWALSFGAECEVLEPAELRQEIQEELERMRSMYRGQLRVPAMQ